MRGAVFLGGGGSADDERDVWRSAYTGVERVLYWPFALTADMLSTADRWLHDSLASLGLTAQVTTWATLDGRDPRDLPGFDLLHVGGGNTFRFLEHIRRHSFIEPVRAFVRHGGAYYGGSAGAVIACDDIEIAAPHDPNVVALTNFSALGLVPSYAVLPHYDGAVDTAFSWTREHHRPLLAIRERGGVRYSDRRFTAIGPETTAEVNENEVITRQVGESWDPSRKRILERSP